MIVLRHGTPEASIEHPVSVRAESEAVAGIVVAADGVLVDVRGLDDGGGFGIEPITGEGAGEVIAAKDVGFKAAVAAFFLAGFGFCGVLLESGDGGGIRNRQP